MQIATGCGAVISSPYQARRPASARHRFTVGERCRRANLITRLQRLGMSDSPNRNLRCPVLGGEKPESSGPGIDGAAFNDPPVFARFGAVESAGFESHLFVRDTKRENIVGDMRSVLPVMRYGRLRQLHRRSPVRKPN